MKLSLRTTVSAASTLALVASGLLFASGTASAATSCYASSCTGLDPSTTICQNDAKTVDYTAPDGDAELRYSPTCRAAWARAIAGGGRVPATIQIENTNHETFTALNTGDHTVYTRMVNDKDIQARASFHYANNTQYGYSGWY
ncbi:DUF2690 domain-containing protein [Kitasatospora sp. NPDC096077]|uniref:DUF2690 domain-containing protein n=1 Tax=Kitasatospora sp. NPDC096077 TaxID=3155544 RepID=UPI003322DD14